MASIGPARIAHGSGVVRSTSVLLAIGFVVLLAIVAVTYMLAERSRASFDEVIAARDTRTTAVEIRNAMLTAESSQRGFVYNGNEIYLAPYDTAKTLALRRYDRLRSLLLADPTASASLDRLKVVMAEKFAEMDNTISLKRQRKDADVAAIVNSNRGKALMDEANIFFNGIILAADDRLTASVAEQKANFAWLRWITIAGGLAIVIVVGFAVASVARYTSALSAARKDLETMNAGLEERVRERTADLVQANEEVQRFAYIVTHDLRAPLVNIMGFTSELETGVASLQALIEQSGIASDATNPLVADARDAATEDLPEAIGFIRSSTRKMDGLINAILRLSREGRRQLKPEWIPLAELVAGAAEAVQHQVREAGGEVSLSLGVTRIESDRLALEQVFANLFDNAVKYRSPARPLKIEVGARIIPGNRISINIVDNGRGIAGQDIERVFELFRRAGVQDQPGEGIGLAHVRSVVRRLGGDISVNSTLDAGTTFRLELPLVASFAERTNA